MAQTTFPAESPAAAAPYQKARRRLPMARALDESRAFPIILLGPVLVFFIVWNVVPLLWLLGVSFYQYKLTSARPAEYIGFENFYDIWRASEVWGLLAEAGVPVVTHCGSGPVPGPFTGPGPIGRVLARHPRLALVVAHLGMPEYGDFLDLAERYDRVMLDTTMAFTDFVETATPFPRAELPRLAALGDRVLLGTDFPNIPYRYVDALTALERAELGDEWLRAVCHDNATRLFTLGRV